MVEFEEEEGAEEPVAPKPAKKKKKSSKTTRTATEGDDVAGLGTDKLENNLIDAE